MRLAIIITATLIALGVNLILIGSNKYKRFFNMRKR